MTTLEASDLSPRHIGETITIDRTPTTYLVGRLAAYSVDQRGTVTVWLKGAAPGATLSPTSTVEVHDTNSTTHAEFFDSVGKLIGETTSEETITDSPHGVKVTHTFRCGIKACAVTTPHLHHTPDQAPEPWDWPATGGWKPHAERDTATPHLHFETSEARTRPHRTPARAAAAWAEHAWNRIRPPAVTAAALATLGVFAYSITYLAIDLITTLTR